MPIAQEVENALMRGCGIKDVMLEKNKNKIKFVCCIKSYRNFLLCMLTKFSVLKADTISKRKQRKDLKRQIKKENVKLIQHKNFCFFTFGHLCFYFSIQNIKSVFSKLRRLNGKAFAHQKLS